MAIKRQFSDENFDLLLMRRSHQARSVTRATADHDTFLIFQVKIRDIASPCDQIRIGLSISFLYNITFANIQNILLQNYTQIRFGVLGHDWSISDDPICYDRIDRSDKTPWVWVRSPQLGSPIWYVQSDLCRYVHVRYYTLITTRCALLW